MFSVILNTKAIDKEKEQLKNLLTCFRNVRQEERITLVVTAEVSPRKARSQELRPVLACG